MLLDAQEVLYVDLHIGDLALGAGGGLMDHNLRIGKGDALALGEDVEGIGCFVALPCLDIEDCRNLFLSVAILLGASYRYAESGD